MQISQKAQNVISMSMLDGNIGTSINFFKQATASSLNQLEDILGSADFEAYRSHVMALRCNKDQYIELMRHNSHKYIDFCNLMQRGTNAVYEISFAADFN